MDTMQLLADKLAELEATIADAEAKRNAARQTAKDLTAALDALRADAARLRTALGPRLRKPKAPPSPEDAAGAADGN